jgi:protein-S-isoprenylcysteine O-methyltransferase Ste14
MKFSAMPKRNLVYIGGRAGFRINQPANMADSSTDTPGVMACPPLFFVGALGLGLFLHWWIPVHPLPAQFSRTLGAGLCLASVVVGIWGGTTMHRAGTNVRPDRPVTALVTGGPFRFSRNPLYLSLTALYLGITLLCDALWPLMTLVPLLVVVHGRIILREERYLESRFGDEYRAYKARVRRWL